MPGTDWSAPRRTTPRDVADGGLSRRACALDALGIVAPIGQHNDDQPAQLASEAHRRPRAGSPLLDFLRRRGDEDRGF